MIMCLRGSNTHTHTHLGFLCVRVCVFDTMALLPLVQYDPLVLIELRGDTGWQGESKLTFLTVHLLSRSPSLSLSLTHTHTHQCYLFQFSTVTVNSSSMLHLARIYKNENVYMSVKPIEKCRLSSKDASEVIFDQVLLRNGATKASFQLL